MDFMQIIFFVLVMIWYIYTIVKAQKKKRPQENPAPRQKPMAPPVRQPKRVAKPPAEPARRIERRSHVESEVRVEFQKKSPRIKNLINGLPDRKALIVLSEILKRK